METSGRHGNVTLGKKVQESMPGKSCDSVGSARPLKYFLERNLETKLARGLIAGDIAEGSEVKFTVQDVGSR